MRWDIAPADPATTGAGAKHPQDAFEHLEIVYRRAATFAAALGLGKQWLKQSPLVIIYEASVFSHWVPPNCLIHKNIIKV
jgi:hypothetical protein